MSVRKKRKPRSAAKRVYIVLAVAVLGYIFRPGITPLLSGIFIVVYAATIKEGWRKSFWGRQFTVVVIALLFTILHNLHYSYCHYKIAENVRNLTVFYATKLSKGKTCSEIKRMDGPTVYYPYGFRTLKIDVKCFSSAIVYIGYISINGCRNKAVLSHRKKKVEFGFARLGLFCSGDTGFFLDFEEWHDNLETKIEAISQ